jgi:hypothetical protein
MTLFGSVLMMFSSTAYTEKLDSKSSDDKSPQINADNTDQNREGKAL